MTDDLPSSSHGAAGSALGYLYQSDWALIELLRASRHRPDQALRLESLDDVEWTGSGTSEELLQIKHHLKRTATLTDKGVDLWRTIKVWLDSPVARADDGPLLTLVTTAGVVTGSAVAHLLPERHDPLRALSLLNLAAQESASKTTKSWRQEWLDLDESTRISMLQRMRVLDNAVAVDGVDAAVTEILHYAVPRGHSESFLGLVWRWWHKVTIDLLRGARPEVSAIEVRDRVDDIRSTFSGDNLPTFVELADVDEELLLELHHASSFVEQMKWVRVNATNLRKAIVDYYRAVEHVTRWVSESLVDLQEISIFEDNLLDEWERVFADMVEDLGAEASEEDKVAAGNALYRKLRDSTDITVRSRFTEPFLSRGSRHQMCNQGRIGWHPDFEERFHQLVLPVLPRGGTLD